MDGMRGLDAWITGGRYSKSVGQVTCPCGEVTTVVTETEYGATEWDVNECKCGREFTGDEPWADAEPPEPDYPDYDDDERWD